MRGGAERRELLVPPVSLPLLPLRLRLLPCLPAPLLVDLLRKLDDGGRFRVFEKFAANGQIALWPNRFSSTGLASAGKIEASNGSRLNSSAIAV